MSGRGLRHYKCITIRGGNFISACLLLCEATGLVLGSHFCTRSSVWQGFCSRQMGCCPPRQGGWLQSQGEALPNLSTWRPHVASGRQCRCPQILLPWRRSKPTPAPCGHVARAGLAHPPLPQTHTAHGRSSSLTLLATLPSGDGDESAPFSVPRFLLLGHLGRDW